MRGEGKAEREDGAERDRAHEEEKQVEEARGGGYAAVVALPRPSSSSPPPPPPTEDEGGGGRGGRGGWIRERLRLGVHETATAAAEVDDDDRTWGSRPGITQGHQRGCGKEFY